MQQSAAEQTAQIENCIVVPRAFYGKEKNKAQGSESFRTASGGRLLASKILTLGYMHTEKLKHGKLDDMCYGRLEGELNFCKTTIAKNLRELRDDEKILERTRKSHYKIVSEYKTGKAGFVPVYSFLLEEPLDCGGVVKKLSFNAVLALSEFIAFDLDPDNKYKHFIGGVHKTAELLNIPESTAQGVIDELKDVKAITTYSLTYDSGKNEMLKPGKGKSSKDLTVFEVKDKLLSKCRAIQKKSLERKAEVKKVKETLKQKHQDKPTPQHKRYVDSLSSKERDELHCENIKAAFKDDEAFNFMIERYNKLSEKFINEISDAGAIMNPSPSMQKIFAEQEGIVEELRGYLIKKGVSPGNIPEDLEEYIAKF